MNLTNKCNVCNLTQTELNIEFDDSILLIEYKIQKNNKKIYLCDDCVDDYFSGINDPYEDLYFFGISAKF